MWTIQGWYDEARKAAEADPAWYINMAKLHVKTYRQHLPDWSDEKILEAIEACNQERLDALPSTTKYPELRGMRDLIDAQWRGVTDGAKLDRMLSAMDRCKTFFIHRYIHGNRLERFAARCTCIYFPTSEAGAIMGNNLDADPDEPFNAPTSIAGEHLVRGGVSSGVPMDEESPEIFPVPVHQLIERYCKTAAEAVEMFERYGDFWGPGNMIVADRDHNVAMIEKTAQRMSVRWSKDGFGFVTAMVQVDPELKKFVQQKRLDWLKSRGMDPDNCDDTVYWAAQDRRQKLMEELLEEARAKPTVEALRKMLQFRDDKRGWSAVCGEPIRPGVKGTGCYEHTLRTQVWLLAQGKAKWWAYDHKTGKPVWENPQPDVTFENDWKWQD